MLKSVLNRSDLSRKSGLWMIAMRCHSRPDEPKQPAHRPPGECRIRRRFDNPMAHVNQGQRRAIDRNVDDPAEIRHGARREPGPQAAAASPYTFRLRRSPSTRHEPCKESRPASASGRACQLPQDLQAAHPARAEQLGDALPRNRCSGTSRMPHPSKRYVKPTPRHARLIRTPAPTSAAPSDMRASEIGSPGHHCVRDNSARPHCRAHRQQ